MFPVMASEPEIKKLVSNVQSCSHEKELFVLLLQTEQEKGLSCTELCLDRVQLKIKIKKSQLTRN